MGGRTCKWESVSYELQNNTPIEILEPRTVKLASMCVQLTGTSGNNGCYTKSVEDQKSMLLYNYQNQNGVQSTTLRILCENYLIWEIHDTCTSDIFSYRDLYRDPYRDIGATLF